MKMDKHNSKRSIKRLFQDAGSILKQDIHNNKLPLILIVAYLFVHLFLLHSRCFIVLLTGYPCPACGLTRAGIALLYFNLNGVLQYNVFILGVVLLGLVAIHRRYFLKKSLNSLVPFCIILFSIMIGYYVYRMFVVFPGPAPMNYSPDNYFSNLRQLF